jgi:hypothetical protein
MAGHSRRTGSARQWIASLLDEIVSQHAIADNNRVTAALAPLRFYTDG